MACKTDPVPNVWICLQKIKGYLDGEYDELEDVKCCIDSLERMFKYVKINLNQQGRLCPNGWVDETKGGGGIPQP